MLAHPLTQTAQRLLQEGQAGQASATLWHMLQTEQGLDRAWLDCVVQLVICLDGAGFRPQAQHWLALAAPVGRRLGLMLREPLPMPAHLAPEVFDQAQLKTLKRYPALEDPQSYIYVIEIAGNCNLRCPSCPVGNMPEEPRARGLMPLTLFEQILDKIAQDRPDTPIVIHLFNWGEPLLHPQLHRFVHAIRARRWRSIVSTTLNIDRGLPELVQAAPDVLKVSMSGWTQQDYGSTHVRGQVDKVKANLRQLRSLMDQAPPADRAGMHAGMHAGMQVVVGYHLYKHNTAGAQQARAFAASLGFAYMENNAVLMPVERNLDVLAGRADALTQDIVSRLPIHPVEVARINRSRRSGQFDCELRFNMTAIDADGSVALCCGTYSRHLRLHPSFVQASRQELEEAKYRSTFCKECMGSGLAYTVNDIL